MKQFRGTAARVTARFSKDMGALARVAGVIGEGDGEGENLTEEGGLD